MPGNKPIKLVHCALATGIGGGIERMDALYHQYLDRSVCDPVFVAMCEKDANIRQCDPAMNFIYTGGVDRFQTLTRLFAEADIVQFSGGFDPLVCEAARLARVPSLVELLHLTERGQLFDYIDISICVSQTVEKIQPDKKRTTIVYNGIDIDSYPFRHQRRDDGKIIVIEASRREKPKHFHLDELAEEILAIDPSIEIWMAGRGHEGESTDRVKFLGLRSDIAHLYRRADFMALFSIKEPFGLVALEAMASGCVPIVSDDGGLAEIVTDGVDGWLAPVGRGKAPIVETIRKAVAVYRTDEFEKIRREARQTVEQKFSPEKCVREYEKLYLKLIQKKGRRRTPGPVEVKPSPEALTGDALFFFNAGDWDMIDKTAQAMMECDTPMRNSQCADVMEKIAAQAVANNRGGVADKIFTKLIESAPHDPKMVLLAAQNLLDLGRVDDAFKALCDGARRMPGSAELAGMRDLLKEKLGL